MNEATAELIKLLAGPAQLDNFASRLLAWLQTDLDAPGEAFTESRARALLLAGNLLDEPTRNDLAALMATEPGARIALYDLLDATGLAEVDEVRGQAAAAAQMAADTESVAQPDWLALIVAAFAWRGDFPLNQLDPASPPEAYSPAGQLLTRSTTFARRQVQRSATERQKLARQLAFDPQGRAATLDSLAPGETAAPLPPHYRTPIPVNYPEYSSDIVRLEEDGVDELPQITREDPIAISEEDLDNESSPPAILPAIRIDEGEVQPRQAAAPPNQVTTPETTRRSTSQRSRSRRKTTQVTKLQVVVQDHPDGTGLYGLQVKVSSRAIRRYVAGTTNQDGRFLCELPVRASTGLTYDVDVTWPRDYGGEVERKSITLNADRTSFTLPFYRKHSA